jgi:hypothetical protein
MVRNKSIARRPPATSHRNGRVATKKTQAQSTEKAPARATQRVVETFHGVLREFNLSPAGVVEGFLLHTDKGTVQVNVALEVGFAVVRGIEQNVEAVVTPEKLKGRRSGHPVYRLVTLRGANGQALICAEPGEAEDVSVQATVKRINYARNGAADGVILDSGDFVHLERIGMKKCGLKVGDAVTVEGTARRMPLGNWLIKARRINGGGVPGTRKAVR